MERKLYLLSPLQAEFYENESDRMYPDDVMDGRALAVYGADILQKMLGGDNSRYLKTGVPNMHVYDTLIKAYSEKRQKETVV